MYRIGLLIKSHGKRMIRMPFLLLVIVLLPFLCTEILNITFVTEAKEEKNIQEVILHIWNASEAKEAEQFVETFSEQWGDDISITKIAPTTIEEATYEIHERIKEYSLSIYMYIPEDFAKRLAQGERAIYLFDAGYDERVEEVEDFISISLMGLKNKEKDDIVTSQMKKLFVNEQGEIYDQIYNGYSFSLHMFIGIVTVCFAMCSMSILELWRGRYEKVIKERMQLSGIPMSSYSLSKLAILLLSLLIESLMVAIGIKLLVKVELGIPIGVFIWILLVLGIVILCFTLLIESIFNVGSMSTYLTIFSIIAGNFFAGIYFPFDELYGWQDRIAILLPQYWTIYTIKAARQGKFSVLLLYSVSMFCLAVLEILLIVKMSDKQECTDLEESI